MLRFDFTKTKEGYIILGKTTPCSSKTKVLNYILRHWRGIEEGSITIKERENAILETLDK